MTETVNKVATKGVFVEVADASTIIITTDGKALFGYCFAATQPAATDPFHLPDFDEKTGKIFTTSAVNLTTKTWAMGLTEDVNLTVSRSTS